MSNSFKSDAAGDANIYVVCAMTTADDESEVQENVVCTLNRKILTCVVLVGCRVKHVQRNMSRGMKKYIAALFCYCYQL